MPIGLVAAGENRHDSPLLQPTLTIAKEQVGALPGRVNVNLDRGYDSSKTCIALKELGTSPLPVRDGTVVDFYLHLAAALVTFRVLIQRDAADTAGTGVPPPGASSDSKPGSTGQRRG